MQGSKAKISSTTVYSSCRWVKHRLYESIHPSIKMWSCSWVDYFSFTFFICSQHFSFEIPLKLVIFNQHRFCRPAMKPWCVFSFRVEDYYLLNCLQQSMWTKWFKDSRAVYFSTIKFLQTPTGEVFPEWFRVNFPLIWVFLPFSGASIKCFYCWKCCSITSGK